MSEMKEELRMKIEETFSKFLRFHSAFCSLHSAF